MTYSFKELYDDPNLAIEAMLDLVCTYPEGTEFAICELMKEIGLDVESDEVDSSWAIDTALMFLTAAEAEDIPIENTMPNGYMAGLPYYLSLVIK